MCWSSFTYCARRRAKVETLDDQARAHEFGTLSCWQELSIKLFALRATCEEFFLHQTARMVRSFCGFGILELILNSDPLGTRIARTGINATYLSCHYWKSHTDFSLPWLFEFCLGGWSNSFGAFTTGEADAKPIDSSAASDASRRDPSEGDPWSEARSGAGTAGAPPRQDRSLRSLRGHCDLRTSRSMSKKNVHVSKNHQETIN